MTPWVVLFASLIGLLVWRAMWREDFDGTHTEARIKRRPELSIDDFYAQYYAHSEISPLLVKKLLEILAVQFGIPAGCIRPTDNLLQSNLADTLTNVVEIVEEFELSSSNLHPPPEQEGTFDNIVRYLGKEMGTGVEKEPPCSRFLSIRKQQPK
jgi:hypothetical protein